MSPNQHWIVRGIAIVVIALCTIKCGVQETIINVPARPPADNGSHLLTVEQLEEQEVKKHPKPICPPETLGIYLEGIK